MRTSKRILSDTIPCYNTYDNKEDLEDGNDVDFTVNPIWFTLLQHPHGQRKKKTTKEVYLGKTDSNRDTDHDSDSDDSEYCG
mmetsp:Transcript_41988/g.98376  ORF Transcript_41988/g.98376 Transcript_41988/m.98376 type:complete len:82 (+) Transcript_41988:965-1210(+)